MTIFVLMFTMSDVAKFIHPFQHIKKRLAPHSIAVIKSMAHINHFRSLYYITDNSFNGENVSKMPIGLYLHMYIYIMGLGP